MTDTQKDGLDQAVQAAPAAFPFGAARLLNGSAQAHIEVGDEDPQVARALVNQVRLERTRQFGGCFLGWELWKQLGLDDFFEPAMDDEAAEVPWSRVAALLAINRLCAPGSELAIEERWYPSMALDEYRTDSRTEIPAAPARPQPAGMAEISFKL